MLWYLLDWELVWLWGEWATGGLKLVMNESKNLFKSSGDRLATFIQFTKQAFRSTFWRDLLAPSPLDWGLNIPWRFRLIRYEAYFSRQDKSRWPQAACRTSTSKFRSRSTQNLLWQLPRQPPNPYQDSHKCTITMEPHDILWRLDFDFFYLFFRLANSRLRYPFILDLYWTSHEALD